MGLVKCEECRTDLSPKNFNEVERIKTGEVVCLCNKCYSKLVDEGRLEHIDKDGNLTKGNLHIFKGTNREEGISNSPCPNCGSASYLGIFIPTVTWFSTDYLGTSFRCHNQACDPIIEKHDILDEAEEKVVNVYYEFLDWGAYWDNEDEFYYTPLSPRF